MNTTIRITRWLTILIFVSLAIMPAAAPSSAQGNPPYPPTPIPSDEFELAQAVKILLPDRAALNYLVENGWDLDHDVEETDEGIQVTVIATPSELAFLQSLGFVQVGSAYDEKAWEARKTERAATLTAQPETAMETDNVMIIRADYWSSQLGAYLSVEAKSSAFQGATLTATWEPAPIFGITCTQAVGLGNVPEDTTFQYSVRLYDPGTNSGSGHVTNRVWQGILDGPAAFNPVINWPISPSQGNTDQDSFYSWEISVPGGVSISEGEGYFDCAAPLPTVPPLASIQLRTFIDAGEYQYHYRQVSVDGRPGRIVVTSNLGGSDTTYATEWVPDQGKIKPYQTGFVDHYMDPTELYDRIESLAAEFPDLAEIIELPYLTNGYRRQAMGLLGSANSNRVVITSNAWGYEGGNGIVVETLNPGSPNTPLSVSVSGNTISISLATDAGGALTSTAAQVIDAINADPAASALIRADKYRLNAGTGVVAPQSITLSDYLSAPASISREPWRVRALRIGLHRDGSKVGVLMYAQEHAREWQTPLVVVETAERLLRNYANGGPAKNLVDNLDIFIIPSVNPDGAHYSFYDYAMQRKNMFNYCLGKDRNDLNSRNSWGVDVNRNYDVGSYYDGYSGGSGSCSSGTYSGPAELSEAESKNVVWVADTFTNIKFGMNVHSSGNYFMWSPGAYIVPGRITLPRPTLGQELYFWKISEQILQAIKTYRGLVVEPGQTGPVADVLYSAAGNSGDRIWYINGVYIWDFEVGTSFQPSWPEAYSEAMEFSNGLIGLCEVALEYANDNQIPTSWLSDSAGKRVMNKKLPGPAELRFSTSEPATIYYTLDGSRPTYSSPVYSASGVREPPAILTFNNTTKVNWFAVDAAGNISTNYQPGDPNSNAFYSVKVRIR